MSKNKNMAISKKIREIVYAKYDGRCAYCGDPITLKEMQVDHIIAQYEYENRSHKMGKGDMDKDDLENLNPACRMCNFYKGTSTIEEFRNWKLKGIIDRLQKSFIFRLALKYKMIEVKRWDGKFYFEKIKEEENLPKICKPRELCKTCYNWLSQEDVGENDIPHCTDDKSNERHYLNGDCDTCESYLNQ